MSVRERRDAAAEAKNALPGKAATGGGCGFFRATLALTSYAEK